MRTQVLHMIALAAVSTIGIASSANAQTLTDFDTLNDGNINGQGGWIATGPYDQGVVDLGGGNKVWRMSNAITSSSFGDMPFAPASGFYSGESASTHKPDVQPANTNRYYASFDFSSATGAAQPGLFLSISPDDGSGRRMSYLGLEDTGSGIDLLFYDTQDNNTVSNRNGGFVGSYIATGLSYGDVHNIAFDITFNDGNIVDGGNGNINGNDVVNILLNGNLIHSGTTWESYHWTTDEGGTPGTSLLGVHAIDTLLFRSGGTAAAGTSGEGYYFDNVFISNVPEPTGIALIGLAGIAMLRRSRRKV